MDLGWDDLPVRIRLTWKLLSLCVPDIWAWGCFDVRQMPVSLKAWRSWRVGDIQKTDLGLARESIADLR